MSTKVQSLLTVPVRSWYVSALLQVQIQANLCSLLKLKYYRQTRHALRLPWILPYIGLFYIGMDKRNSLNLPHKMTTRLYSFL